MTLQRIQNVENISLLPFPKTAAQFKCFYKHQTQAQPAQTQQMTLEQEFDWFLHSALTQVSATETLFPLFFPLFQIVTQFYVTLTVVAISLFQSRKNVLL